MQQDVLAAQLVEQICRLGRQAIAPSLEARKLEVGPLHVAVKIHHARQVHRPLGAKDLLRAEFEVGTQPFNDLLGRAALDLHAHGVTLAPVVQLGPHTLQYAARLLLLQIQVAVARHPERGPGEHLVPTEHAPHLRLDQLVQHDEFQASLGAGKRDQAGQSAWNGDHTQRGRSLGRRPAAALRAKQQRDAERLVQHPGEGM